MRNIVIDALDHLRRCESCNNVASYSVSYISDNDGLSHIRSHCSRCANRYVNDLSTKLLAWHSGQFTGCYCVGSLLFSGKMPPVDKIALAIYELNQESDSEPKLLADKLTGIFWPMLADHYNKEKSS